MKIQTRFTEMMGCDMPIIVAPMFLVSDVGMTVAGSEAGGVGAFPALNARPVEKLREWLQAVKKQTDKPYAVNLIVNRTNIYFPKQMEICLEEKVPMIIASLGDPSELIKKADEVGTKVFCDVIRKEHAQKAVNAGAHGLIAVCGGAGGHGGAISSMVWVPFLKKHFDVPILAAGNITDGRGLAAMLALGADGASIGTRFIASKECPVVQNYKDAIVESEPHDIVTTYKLDGVPANVINTKYVQKKGTQLNVFEKLLFKSRKLRPMMMAYRTMRSIKPLTEAAKKPTWKELWGAGQGVGLIDEVDSIEGIMEKFAAEYAETIANMPNVGAAETEDVLSAA